MTKSFNAAEASAMCAAINELSRGLISASNALPSSAFADAFRYEGQSKRLRRRFVMNQPYQASNIALIGEEVLSLDEVEVDRNLMLDCFEVRLRFEVVRGPHELIQRFWLRLDDAIQIVSGVGAAVLDYLQDYEGTHLEEARKKAQEIEDAAHQKALLEIRADDERFGSW